MILLYDFEYISKNLVLENFLKVICEEFGVKYKLRKEGEFVKLYIDEDEQRQHEFADHLSSMLPLSLFLKSSNAKITDSIVGKEINIKSTAISLPFTKNSIECAKDAESFYHNHPFPPNEVGFINYNVTSLTLEDENSTIVANSSSDYKNIYKKIANLIKNGKKIKIKTPNGIFLFFEINKENMKDIDDFEVIPTDISLVQKMVNITQEELQILMTLEKPIMRAKVNMVYETKEILSKNRIKIRMPNSVMLQLICEELFSRGVEFICKSSDTKKYDSFLDYDVKIPKIPDIEVTLLENGEIVIIKGDEYASDDLKKDLDKFKDNSIRKFVSILKERELFDFKSSCFYFSKRYDDKVMYHDNDKGMLSLVGFPAFSSIRDIFSAIKKMDENGEKLIEKYQDAFPKLYSFLHRAKIPKRLSNNFFNYISFVSLIVGFSDNFKDAGEVLIEKAEDFGGQKGVRIDMKLQNEDKIHSDFDPYRFLRSAMSFKLAGCDDMTLSYGIIESFAYFISDMADAHKETLGSQKITLGGSLFGYKLISEPVAKNLLANHNIYFNHELSID